MPGLRQLFLKHLAPTSAFPLLLEIERGEGVYLFGSNGERWIDLISGIGVSGLGHSHPVIKNAVKEQVDKYMHTMVYGEYVMAPQVELATLLTQQLPDNLNSVYYVNSGSEATEGAMKLAKRYTGRREIIACEEAYHGSTHGAASLMSPKDFTRAYFPLLPGISNIKFNEAADLEKITEKTACVIVETVQGESGIHPPLNNYLQKLRKRCNETGALLILDEVQAGYGRTGSLFAFEQYGIVPDILLLAKGMGGGMPIGAFVSSQEIMNVFSHDPILGHITTFGGHPVSCAAALANLKYLLETDYVQQVKTKANLFKELLVHPKIKEIRNAGLMMAVQLDSFEEVEQVIKYSLDHGLIVDWFLFNSHSLRIAPPLIIEEEEIRTACRILLEALDFSK